MRSPNVFLTTFSTLVAGAVLLVAPPAQAQDNTAPPGGRAPASTVAPPSAAVIDPTAVPSGSTVAPTVVLNEATQTRSADAQSESDVRRIVLTLVGIAVVMALTTFGFWWATKPLAPELDRLATMGTRGFRRASSIERREMLGRSPLTRLARMRDGVPASDPPVPAAANERGDEARPPPTTPKPAVVAESDRSIVEADPVTAMQRPVVTTGERPEEGPDDAAGVEPSPHEVADADDPSNEADADREASAGPVTG